MTKKLIQELVEASYTKNKLDSKKAEKIATFLKRSELKLYLRGLKLSEKSRTISLVLPNKKFYNISAISGFKKDVLIAEDPSLLMGAKIIDNDTVLDMTLKNSLNEIIQSL